MMEKKLQNKGFTIIEVMITVSILAIVAMIAFPSVKNAIKGFRARNAVSDISSNIKLTRSQAIKESERTYIVAFDAAGKSYSFGFDTNSDLVPDGFGQGAPKTVNLSEYSNELSFGSDAANGPPGSLSCSGAVPGNGMNFPGTPPNVRFNGDGSVSTTGGVFVKDTTGDNYCVSIDSIAGTIMLWRWEGGNNWKKLF